MKIRLTSAAEADFAEAAGYYNEAEEGLGSIFINAVNTTVSKIGKYPFLGQVKRKSIRSIATSRFPFNIIYEIIKDEIVIHAIAHHSQKPDYWVDRTLED